VAEAVTYKKPRKFNIVVILLLLALASGAYMVWVFVPIMIRKAEAMRVLDETSSEFTGQASRMVAYPDLVAKMRRDMEAHIRELGVSDPEAEFWIEIDDENQIRFGALYSEWIKLPFGEPRERVVEIQMFCSRPGRGTKWTCEGQDLQSAEFATDDLPVP
jgi:hypothetical protein